MKKINIDKQIKINNIQKTMKTLLTLLFAAYCLLVIGCPGIFDVHNTDVNLPSGYGSVNINFSGDEGRTIIPAKVFENYVYTFKKGSGEPQVLTPNNGYFVLETGDWSVEVKAYAGAVNESNLAATGTANFTVVNQSSETITVNLEGEAAEGEGSFSYNIQYPSGTTLTTFTLQKLPSLQNVTLGTPGATLASGTVNDVPAGFYLLTVRLKKDEYTAGLIQVIHIYNAMTAVYGTSAAPVVFTDSDFINDKITNPITGNLGDYSFGYMLDGVSHNYQQAVWTLSTENIAIAKATGAQFVLELSVIPTGSMQLVWQSPNGNIWWQDNNIILNNSGNVVSGKGVSWNVHTKTLIINLPSALMNYSGFSAQSSLNLVIAYFGSANINDLGITSATIGVNIIPPRINAVDIGDNMYILQDTSNNNSYILDIKLNEEQWRMATSGEWVEWYDEDGIFEGGHWEYYSALQEFSNSTYEKLYDDFDIISFVLNTPRDNAIINSLMMFGENLTINSNVQGIGKEIYDGTWAWGSAGKLQSINYFPYYDALMLGPSLHELVHTWARGWDYITTYNPDNSEAYTHWGVSNAGGQLGGFKYVRTVSTSDGKTYYQGSMTPHTNPDGSFTNGGFGTNANGGNGVPYSDIELYLMGMISAQELRNKNFTLDIYTGLEYDPTFASGYFYATGVTSYTIDDLIELYGERVPNADVSQKSFKHLTVILSRENDITANSRYEEIVDQVRWLGGDYTRPGLFNFMQATNNIGFLEVGGVMNSLKN